MTKVEKIGTQDIERILELAEIAHTESAYREYPFDREGMRGIIITCCGENNSFFGVKCVDGAETVGVMMAMLTKMPFSTQVFGVDCGIYILPEHRGGWGFRKMLKLYTDWCEAKSVVPLLCLHYGEDNSRTYKLVENLGFSEKGRMFTGKV